MEVPEPRTVIFRGAGGMGSRGSQKLKVEGSRAHPKSQHS